MLSPYYINGKFLTQRLTGVQRYAHELTKELLKNSEAANIIAPAKHYWNNHYEGMSKVKTTKSGGGVAWEQIILPVTLRKLNNPLLLNLCNVSPVFYENKITCIHDVGFVRYPQFYSRKFYLFYKNIIPIIIKYSRHILTVSEFSKSELIDYYKIPENGITIISNGVSDLSNKAILKDSISPVDLPYFLFVGSLNPQKNLLFLLNCFVKSEVKNMKLVIIGAGSRSFNKKIHQSLRPYLSNSQIIFLGSINDSELARYYSFADALIAPSQYEGFGLPVIEALSAGCPVYASDIPAFREIGKDAITYFNPAKESELIEIIRLHANHKFPLGKVEKLTSLLEEYDWKLQAKRLSILLKDFI